MSFHTLFGKHVADLKASRWDCGRFVSACAICGCDMIKPPGGEWRAEDSGVSRR